MQRLTRQLMNELKLRSSLSTSTTTSLVPESMSLLGTPLWNFLGHPNATHPLTMVIDPTAFPLISEQWSQRRHRQSSSSYTLGNRRVELW